MTKNINDNHPNNKHHPKTAQEYIDEKPTWSSGECLARSNISSMQWMIWWLAGAGKFFEGMLVFMSGLTLPLISLTFSMNDVEKGLYTAIVLIGIFVGAFLLGGLADRYGRRRMFVIEIAWLLVFVILAVVSVNYVMLMIMLFGVGMALGCDYPTAHLMISESIPTELRGRFVLGAFGFQALGAFMGVLVIYLILLCYPYPDAWRIAYAVTVLPIMVIGYLRMRVPESSIWLSEKNKMKEARASLKHLLKRKRHIHLKKPTTKKNIPTKYRDLFSKHVRRATLLTSIPWFLQDLGTYGMGIFMPLILLNLFGFSTDHINYNLANIIHADRVSARYTVGLDFTLMLGIIAAVLLVNKLGRIKLQVIGFIGCMLGLLLVSIFIDNLANLKYVLLGFIIFNFMTNMGPNTQTYLLSGESFPTGLRGRGAGFAASSGKLGAILIAFCFPILIRHMSESHLLQILAATSLLGAIVTWLFRPKIECISLERV